jgi:signal transduction histidine kinase
MYQLAHSIPPFLTAALLAFMAVVALRRAFDSRSGRLFAMLCLLGSLLYVDMLISFNAPSATMALKSTRLGHILHPFLLPVFLHFFHVHLNITRRAWLPRLAYGYAALLALAAPGERLIASVHHFSFGFYGQAGPLYPFMAAGAVLVTAYNLVILQRAIAGAPGSIAKNKLAYVLVGFGTLGILTCLNILTLLGCNLYPPGAFGFIPMAVFAAGVFRYDLLDMGLLIRKTLLFCLLPVALAGVCALLISVVQRRLGQEHLVGMILVLTVFFLTILLVWSPLRIMVSRISDGLSGKKRTNDQETIAQVSRSIAAVLNQESITRLLQETIIDTMQVKNCALFVVASNGDGFETRATAGQAGGRMEKLFLEANTPLPGCLLHTAGPIRKQRLMGSRDSTATAVLSEMNRLGGEVALPMRFNHRLNGFLLLGEKLSGHVYHARELHLLETLCHQSAVAIENARAYRALEHLNQTLEEKVAERTRDLEAALAEKERTQEQLIRSESLAALGQLVAGAAHELNNPLASVTSILQSTAEDLEDWEPHSPPDEELLDDLRFADKELARARSIVASLLGLSRQTQTYEESVDLNVVVRDALRILHNQYKHASLHIVEELNTNLPTVSGNFANLGQVVLNIIQNAIQAVADQTGRLVLQTRYSSADNQVVFSCHDNGPGIDPALHKDIFKPFFTTKTVGQGTGLGLYICHEILRKHGGTVAVESANGNGTRMVVRLPVESEV